ncbi:MULTISPECIES: Txe/YoeB family addiction module toxin [unclassified Rhizobium]|uniref:Txe/YoeB family addiction module toxin n=1 Tax=Rhizobium TaxID=379 RepID=UPI0009F3D3AC|nr:MULTISPECIES: Txe/YoeB family addiction module toxin [unclassified Rhizobium]QYA11061.1 Txe/YoeB family addiction module toxin [Rhizobium sp. AB2/73]UEQ79407.1 Txe/YoeB family addiction module toxin [Rhizobium sp. AB2/73]
MLLAWHAHAWEDYLYWRERDRKIAVRINELLRDALRHPFEGLGKPEALRNQLKGQWSRRITQEHRLIYKVEGEGDRQILIVLQCRFHY